jgi:uncharacterized protein (TIGR03067 family)
MKLHFLTILTAVLLLGAAPGRDTARGDSESLEGTWSLVSVEINAQPLSMDKLKDSRLVVKGVSYSFRLGDARLAMTYKLDPGKSPKTLDLTLTEGPDKGKTYHAIYRLEGDTLTICRSVEPDKERPTEFATMPGSGLMLVVWKRDKP